MSNVEYCSEVISVYSSHFQQSVLQSLQLLSLMYYYLNSKRNVLASVISYKTFIDMQTVILMVVFSLRVSKSNIFIFVLQNEIIKFQDKMAKNGNGIHFKENEILGSLIIINGSHLQSTRKDISILLETDVCQGQYTERQY